MCVHQIKKKTLYWAINKCNNYTFNIITFLCLVDIVQNWFQGECYGYIKLSDNGAGLNAVSCSSQ